MRSGYSFSPKNTNYINAIATHNKNVKINKINSKDVSDKNYTGSQLPELVKGLNTELVEIECSSPDSVSTTDVFPKLTALEKAFEEHDKNNADFVRAEAARIAITNYFNNDSTDDEEEPSSSEEEKSSSEEEKESNSDEEEKSNSDKEKLVSSIPSETALPKLRSLTAMQAVYVICGLNNIFHFSGAIHLEALNTILFQIDDQNFVLRYGAKSSLEIYTIALDIDDGFCNINGNLKHLGDEHYSKVLNELNKHFLAWKNNNYQGNVIPETSSGFVLRNKLSRSSARQDVSGILAEISETEKDQTKKTTNGQLPESNTQPPQLTKEDRQKNNELLYKHQRTERYKRNARIAFFSIVGVISAATLILIPLAIYLKRRVSAELLTNNQVNVSNEKIWKIKRSGIEEQAIRTNRKEFKINAIKEKLLPQPTSNNAKPEKTVPKKVVKYVTTTKMQRDNMFMVPVTNCKNTAQLFSSRKLQSNIENGAIATAAAKLTKRR